MLKQNRKRSFAAGTRFETPSGLNRFTVKCVEAFTMPKRADSILQQYVNRLRGNDGRLPACAIL